MPATAWDSSCSAWFLVFSHWLMPDYSFSHRSCSLSGWQCLVALLCSARFTFSVRLLEISAFLWPAISPALCYLAPLIRHLDPSTHMDDNPRRLDILHDQLEAGSNERSTIRTHSAGGPRILGFQNAFERCRDGAIHRTCQTL